MIPDPAVGDVVLVRVWTGYEAYRGGKDTARVHPAVRARVAYRGAWGGGGPQGHVYSVVLLEWAAPGWEAGDTYRCHVSQMSPAPEPAGVPDVQDERRPAAD